MSCERQIIWMIPEELKRERAKLGSQEAYNFSGGVAVQYWTSLKALSQNRRTAAAALGDLSKVSSELLFLDDEKVICVCLNQPEVMKALHKHADPGTRRAHHLRQFFMRDFQFDANAARVFLAHSARQIQQCLPQALFAIDRHQIGDDLLLIGDPHRQVLHETLKQRVAV